FPENTAAGRRQHRHAGFRHVSNQRWPSSRCISSELGNGPSARGLRELIFNGGSTTIDGVRALPPSARSVRQSNRLSRHRLAVFLYRLAQGFIQTSSTFFDIKTRDRKSTRLNSSHLGI